MEVWRIKMEAWRLKMEPWRVSIDKWSIRLRVKVKSWIQIRIEVKNQIRIRIKAMRIRNPGSEVNECNICCLLMPEVRLLLLHVLLFSRAHVRRKLTRPAPQQY
jgi:hypothetical protein